MFTQLGGLYVRGVFASFSQLRELYELPRSDFISLPQVSANRRTLFIQIGRRHLSINGCNRWLTPVIAGWENELRMQICDYIRRESLKEINARFIAVIHCSVQFAHTFPALPRASIFCVTSDLAANHPLLTQQPVVNAM